uniref:Putative nucleotidyltransferase n=1 Tax=Streptomyces sp. SANK 60405 TaxID=689687 RepID=D4QF26_9ACTN|nr:putative nucleotidyltransferase [Streptomyces sp. SANK 60405]
MKVSVIIAMAGEGTRFGARYPKELHALCPHRTVLHCCVAPLTELDPARLRIIGVVGAGRARSMDVIEEELGKPGAEVVFTAQNPQRHGPGLEGAVRAGLPFCEGVTAVVLADQIFTTERPGDLTRTVDAARRHGRSALVYPTTDPEALRADGAVAFDRPAGVITQCEEKPQEDLDRFDGLWVVPMVSPEHRDELPAIATDPAPVLSGAKYVEVGDYVNVTRPSDVWGRRCPEC